MKKATKSTIGRLAERPKSPATRRKTSKPAKHQAQVTESMAINASGAALVPESEGQIVNESTLDANMIHGKGYYIWNADRVLQRTANGDLALLVQKAKQAGIEHVIVKIADGTQAYPLPHTDSDGSREKITEQVINKLREAGIVVWGWAFAYGPAADPEAQAQRFAERARHFGISGLVIDAEERGEFIWSSVDGEAAARRYVARLRSAMAGVANLLIGFSSYRYIRFHQNFPFAAFLEGCDIAMPQVYWVARSDGDAVRNLQESREDYKSLLPQKLYIPTGAAYGEQQAMGNERWFWSATPLQIRRFLEQAKAMRLPAVTFWSWEHAINDVQNSRFPGSELWDAVANFHFVSEQVSTELSALEATSDLPLAFVRVNDSDGYQDGIFANSLGPGFVSHIMHAKTMKYTTSMLNDASVWALWQPPIAESGAFEISVWIPNIHATTRQANYQIHGVARQAAPMTFQVNQKQFNDEWVSLGIYELDAAHPHCGQVLLTNATGEADREVGFADIAWQKVVVGSVSTSQPLADGFDPPVGTEAERHSAQVWPGAWVDANAFNRLYPDSTNSAAFHTGADLNLNSPVHDSDVGQPVFAVASGMVSFAGRRDVWGRIVIIQHDPFEPGGDFVCSRSAHLATIAVTAGQRVSRGQQIGTVGRPEPDGSFNHLHFDISPTHALLQNAGDWPKLDRPRLLLHYVDAKKFIEQHRPGA